MTGPVGMPLGTARSGIRLVWVTDSAMENQYYEFGALPNINPKLQPAGK